ncbi:hypothetical protein TNCV_3496641 [Trichonephila clavipes]|nr:hypothetical protein TNCV_3496641 [Trichonephila clavipes]
MPDLRNPGHFFRITSFDFDRVSQYRVALMVLASKKSSYKTPWASQKTARSTLPAEGVVLNFFRTGDDGLFHSIDVTFASGNVVDALLRKVDDLNKANRRITIDGVVEELEIGHKRAQKMKSPGFFLEGVLKLIKRYMTNASMYLVFM